MVGLISLKKEKQTLYDFEGVDLNEDFSQTRIEWPAFSCCLVSRGVAALGSAPSCVRVQCALSLQGLSCFRVLG